MSLAAVLFLISALGAGLVDTLGLLIVFRVIGGIGVGMASVIAPAYIAEIAPASIRGRLRIGAAVGDHPRRRVALLVDYVLAESGRRLPNLIFAFGLEAWRWMFLAMTVPAVLYGGLAVTIPESPRYLVSRMRLEAAKDVLRRVLGQYRRRRQGGGDPADPPAASGLRSWRTCAARHWGCCRSCGSGIGLSVFQQFVGINVIFYYSSVLWQAVGFSENSSLVITVITSVVNIVTTLVAISLIDRVGRKPLLLVGSAGMALTLGIYGRDLRDRTNERPRRTCPARSPSGQSPWCRPTHMRVLLRDVLGSRRMGDAGQEVAQPDSSMRRCPSQPRRNGSPTGRSPPVFPCSRAPASAWLTASTPGLRRCPLYSFAG